MGFSVVAFPLKGSANWDSCGFLRPDFPRLLPSSKLPLGLVLSRRLGFPSLRSPIAPRCVGSSRDSYHREI